MAKTMRSAFPSRVLRVSELPSIDRGHGARTTPLVTRAVGATAFLNGITSFEPGSAIGHHLHNCVESVMVIDGEAFVDIDGVETPLSAGDVTFVPANIPHHFRNASDTMPMRILWIYASIDATRTLTATGVTGRVDAEQAPVMAQAAAVVTELVELDVLPDREELFLAAIAEAAPLFQRARGCRSFELFACEEAKDSYRLLIEWSSLTDHMIDFRESPDFLEWRRLVTPHLASPPRAGHLRRVVKSF